MYQYLLEGGNPKVPSFLFIHLCVLIKESLTKLLEVKFEEPEFEDCYIYDITADVAKKIVVYIDSDSYIDFRKCQRISRYLEQYIDEKGWLGEKYILEVSSPGLDKPLKFKRQYVKNIGRTLNITAQEGEQSKGVLKSVREDDIVIEYKERIKEGKKKRTVTRTKTIRFEDIEKTIVEISFK
ncbi:MAG: ribosome maturation factor [Bacteroidia bacterium]|nr:ribosome maturation factor [Bacteroidia bacterium]